jgi:hypothetical protein
MRVTVVAALCALLSLTLGACVGGHSGGGGSMGGGGSSGSVGNSGGIVNSGSIQSGPVHPFSSTTSRPPKHK